MSEFEETVLLANKILDRPSADPDDDLAMLSRQFLRCVELMTPKEKEISSAVAGMAWRDIAASAYRAYAASTGNKNFRGDPMPAFNDLPQAIQTAWECAVRQAGYCLKVPGEGPCPDESRWTGWKPPHL